MDSFSKDKFSTDLFFSTFIPITKLFTVQELGFFLYSFDFDLCCFIELIF